MDYNQPQCGQAKTALTERTRFSSSIEGVQKALFRLEESVGHIYSQFAPILNPDAPTPCGTADKEAPMCDYEAFMFSTSRKINGLCERLDAVCARSVI